MSPYLLIRPRPGCEMGEKFPRGVNNELMNEVRVHKAVLLQRILKPPTGVSF